MPWIHWRLPTVLRYDPAPDDAVRYMVTVEYNVAPVTAPGFIKAINGTNVFARRDGAYRWGIFRYLENPQLYVGTFQARLTPCRALVF
jgi:Transmembrane secretion effector